MDLFRSKTTKPTLIPSVTESSSIPSSLSSPLELSSPDSVSVQDPTRLATLLSRWKNKPASEVSPTGTGSKHAHAPIESSANQVPIFEERLTSSTIRSTPSLRLPRHVPIVIPEYALSHAHSLTATQLSDDQYQNSALASNCPADAIRLGSISPKSCQEKIFQNPSQTAMNISQVSLSASESGVDSAASSIHQSHSHSNLGNASASPVTHQGSAAAGNVSGFVCNVYRTTGQEPHPLVGATTTILGDKLYVFGGRVHSKTRPTLSSDLYELDLIRRHWTKLETTGDIPIPRYFHSVCALGDSKLVCYGGMSPAPHLRQSGSESQSPNAVDPQSEMVIMNDIHVYDVPTNKWTEIHPLRSDHPEGRYAHCATILPSSAVFTAADSHTSAIHNNPSSSDPHTGQLGVQIDGTGGAELVIVGGQDGANTYIEQISVFNLRSLRWTSKTPYDRKCGAYKSIVAGLSGISGQYVRRNQTTNENNPEQIGTPMLIYSNYNFLDVRLELQVRWPDGKIEEKPMAGSISPPGLRFPNGGVINGHFVVSGTYLTSSKHEYALWALDLRTLTWAMIDTAGTSFGQGSWNRGVLWSRRNIYVILGHRKRNLVEDYNHRRINFAHMCLVELEAYGLYDNPRKNKPTSGYISNSAPAIPLSLQQDLPTRTAGGRTISAIAEQLGHTALYVNEMCDMDIIAQNGERIPCNSNILARRWGPYFNQLMLDATLMSDGNTMSEAVTLRPNMGSRASRISALTITPSSNGIGRNSSVVSVEERENQRSQSRSTMRTLVDIPNSNTAPASSRGRHLYLPHLAPTIKLMLHYLYTSSLPAINSPLCSPHTLCSLLQMARPYQIDGLQEATIERLHEVLDGRNAAAVFNAAAMAAGGGRATGNGAIGTLEALERRESAATVAPDDRRSSVAGNNFGARRGHRKTNSQDSISTATTSTTFSHTDTDSPSADQDPINGGRKTWNGEWSSVIGLQKRGLRGLMEGRRLRERANTAE